MLALLTAIVMSRDVSIQLVHLPPSGGKNAFYVGNRAPLAPTPFRKLPIGSIKPRGWVRKQLQLEADGFIGHLGEISAFLKKDDNAWLSPSGEGQHGWEEVPYWLKGFGDLGYVLGNKRIIDEARYWLDHVMKSQDADGWFGPRSNRINSYGKPDMWPNMPMLNALQSFFEFGGDRRVLTVMGRYFRWQLIVPEDDFYLSYWEKQRGGDNLASVFWLYNRTGEPWLLDLARKIHRRTAPWAAGIPDYHGVNFAQAFREPAQMAQLEPEGGLMDATEADYGKMREEYGQVPGGLYGADENARPGYTDPRQAAETCAMVEMMFSHEMLLTQTGDRKWAERCEDVAFNSLPASMTCDLKALHYLTAPNMPLADKRSKAPGLQNSGPMLLFDPTDHRCCQHNVSHGWPYYAEHLWFATDGNGLGAALYAPCEVTARVGDGTPVTVREITDYPFSESVDFHFETAKSTKFPLTLRLPSWCRTPSLKLNGKAVHLPRQASATSTRSTGDAGPGTTPGKSDRDAYIVINRTWRNGDRLTLSLPMHIDLIRWPGNKNAASVQRGPLTYSLQIQEKAVRQGGTDRWPAFELRPESDWNFGLVDDPKSFKFHERSMPRSGQPFNWDSSPVWITAPARMIPGWGLDFRGLVEPLQPSPVLTKTPIRQIKLIPLGAARLRISSFPTANSKQGRAWVPLPKAARAIPAVASHVWESDTVDALTDGLLPKSSNDESIPRFTWWDHKGGTEWVELDYPVERRAERALVYWFDDRYTNKGCRVPESWKLLYWDGTRWSDVQAKTGYGLNRDSFNEVLFSPVVAKSFRVEVKLQPGYSSGILEWSLK